MRFKSIIISTYSLLAVFFSSYSQDIQKINIDSSKVFKKEFSDNIPEKYSGDEFNYNVSVVESQNYLLRAIRWFFDKLSSIFGPDVDPDFIKIVEILIYIVLIIIATFIIIRLFAGTKATSFFNKKSKELAPLSFEEEHIEEISPEELISNALKVADYRLAIRYKYLKVLKDLSLKNLIDWHYDKTNIDYTNEIKSPTIKKLFGKASHLYDYIWYGEFSLDETKYKSALKEFDQLNKAIQKHG